MNPDELEVTIPYKFSPRDYQRPFLHELDLAIQGKSEKRFFYIIWHRRAGKDLSCISDAVPGRLIKDPCLVKYIYPTSVMGRDNLWDGIDKNGMKFIDHIPESLRVGEANETRMQIKVENGTETPSIFQVTGANRPDSLRGGNPKMFIFSEWAEHDPYAWDVVEPILRENDGIAIFNTTPKGDNHARSLYEFAKNNPKWWVQTLTYKDTGIFTEAEYQQIVEDTIKRFAADGRSVEEATAYCEQEYMCSFNSPVIGAYYGAALRKAELEGRICKIPYDQALPVHTFWDLGVDDSTSIWFMQQLGAEYRFIDYYENTGEGLPHYAQVLQEKKYVYGRHYGPHDIQVRELGSGKSRWEIARNLGVKFETVPALGIDEGINAGRTIFNQCYFEIDKCNRGVQCLKNYKKEWDEKNKVFRNNPLHNWASHGSDSFRTFATGFRNVIPYKQPTTVGGVKPFFPGMPG